ncbi:MAG: hypothetical protein ACW981_11235 [Candidatus Hodarchaeales archaeon]|jgi:hypothetical protein
MKLNGFNEYLRLKKVPTDKISSAIEIVNDLNTFLNKKSKSIESATYSDFYDYSEFLIQKNANSVINFTGILRYGYYSNNNTLILVCMEILDGSEMIKNFSLQLINEFGLDLRDEIFQDLDIPPLGIRPEEKPEITKTLVNRLITKMGIKKSEEFFRIGLRDKYIESYIPAREKYLQSKNIDEFLKQRHNKLITTLEKHEEEGSLFFTQEIDKNVLDYVRNNPVESGIRENNKIFVTKIPYSAKNYFEQEDEKLKRYYFCHNPWIREALKTEEKPIDPIFCNCSGAYFKNYWDYVLDESIKVDVLESVIQGDIVCKFVINLPESLEESKYTNQLMK